MGEESEIGSRMGRFEGQMGKFEDQLGKFEDQMGKFEGQMGKFDERLGRFEDRLGRFETRLDGFDHGQNAMRETISDIKVTLGQVMTLLIKLTADVAEIRGKTSDIPSARDFGQLEGRVEEMSARLPVTLGYQQPGQR